MLERPRRQGVVARPGPRRAPGRPVPGPQRPRVGRRRRRAKEVADFLIGGMTKEEVDEGAGLFYELGRPARHGPAAAAELPLPARPVVVDLRRRDDQPDDEAGAPAGVGPLVAGVVGQEKYAYDIWGSTVNIASRMESNGEPGQINISAATYELIKDDYKCTHRGKIYAKNVGDIDMYFLGEEIKKTEFKNENLNIPVS